MDLRHLGRIALGCLGMEFDHTGGVRQRQLGLYHLLARLQLIEAVAHLLRAAPVLDLADQPLRLPVDLRKLPLECGPDLGCLAREALALDTVSLYRGCNDVRLQEMASQGGKHAGLDLDRADAAGIVAAVTVDPSGAAEVGDVASAVAYDHACAAAAADEEARKQVLGPTVVHGVWPDPCGAKGLRTLEYVGTDDGQLGDVLCDPLVLRVGPGLPPPGRRVLDEALTIVGDAPRIEAVVQETVAALGRADQGGHVPVTASGPWDSLGVKRLHDLQRRAALHVLGIDATDHAGLGLVDGPPAAILAVAHNVVAVAAAAGDAPGLDAADLSALRLLGQVVEEHAAEEALDGNKHLVHVAVRQGDDPHTPVGELPVERGAVGKVAAQPVQALREHRIEATRLSRTHQVLQTGAVDHGRARDRGVSELLNDQPALASRMLACEGKLIGYRPDVLEVGAETGVDGDAHGGVPSLTCSAA